MKNALYLVVNELKVVDATYIWRKLHFDGAHTAFPNLFKLVLIMFLIPVQTAVVERGFSLHKLIKSKLRNRLQISTVDSLLRIKLMYPLKGYLEKLDVDAAAKKFAECSGSSLILKRLHQKMHAIEIGRLEDGVDEGDADLDLSDDCGADDEESEPWLYEDDDDDDDASEAPSEGEEIEEEGQAPVPANASFLDDV